MHDLMTYINRRAETLQRQLHDLDGAVYPGTKAARRGQEDRQRGPSFRLCEWRFLFVGGRHEKGEAPSLFGAR
jgi:hypothetical protein